MEKRISRLQKNIKGDGKAFLITSGVNRFYLTDFSSSEGAVLITKKMLICWLISAMGKRQKKRLKDVRLLCLKSFWKV